MIDYLIMEAIAAKVTEEDGETRKKKEQDQKIKEWKADKSELRALAG